MKYYRVIKDTFLWEKGAILKQCTNGNHGYEPIEDIWNKTENQTEYITTKLPMTFLKTHCAWCSKRRVRHEVLN